MHLKKVRNAAGNIVAKAFAERYIEKIKGWSTHRIYHMLIPPSSGQNQSQNQLFAQPMQNSPFRLAWLAPLQGFLHRPVNKHRYPKETNQSSTFWLIMATSQLAVGTRPHGLSTRTRRVLIEERQQGAAAFLRSRF